MKRIIIACALLATILTSAFAQETGSGNFIRSNICDGDGKSLECMTFVIGAINGIYAQAWISPAPVLFCLPFNSTNGQRLEIFLKYLADHPEKLHESAARLLYLSLIQAFPCVAK